MTEQQMTERTETERRIKHGLIILNKLSGIFINSLGTKNFSKINASKFLEETEKLLITYVLKKYSTKSGQCMECNLGIVSKTWTR